MVIIFLNITVFDQINAALVVSIRECSKTLLIWNFWPVVYNIYHTKYYKSVEYGVSLYFDGPFNTFCWLEVTLHLYLY